MVQMENAWVGGQALFEGVSVENFEDDFDRPDIEINIPDQHEKWIMDAVTEIPHRIGIGVNIPGGFWAEWDQPNGETIRYDAGGVNIVWKN